jgi:hypothetical protein
MFFPKPQRYNIFMRFCLCFAVLVAAALAATVPPAHETLRGKLDLHEGKPPILYTADHKKVILDGDETTRKVLADSRVNGFTVEVRGHFTSSGTFLIDASHTHPMLVRKDGHLKLITYWCDVCAIRAYTPGPCACCQKETTLDLVDPDDPDKK